MKQVPCTLPPELSRSRALGCKEAAELLGVSMPTLRRMYRTGAMPAPIKLTDRLLAWQAGVLCDWLASKNSANAA
jgi:predicted DNA-binding transcriptional regulator AlpA